MILNDFDKDKTAILNPDKVESRIEGFPKVGISCFSYKLIDKYVELYNPKQIGSIKTGNGEVPIYEMNYKGTSIALFMSRVGASPCVVGYEEVLAMGLEELVLFGTCGVLDKAIEDCSIIIPTSAVRDEGTSYHYVEASDEISANEHYIKEFEEILDEHGYSHIKGKTWTTDAPYRETASKMKKRKEAGCVCVDMELSAMFAVSKFRNKKLFQFFYAADNLDSKEWDMRSLTSGTMLEEKEKVVLLALELAKKISDLYY